MGMRLDNTAHPYASTRWVRIISSVIPCRGSLGCGLELVLFRLSILDKIIPCNKQDTHWPKYARRKVVSVPVLFFLTLEYSFSRHELKSPTAFRKWFAPIGMVT